MARRNPGISPILSARGYGARVLWPQYTPDGGVNSGSEIPVPPRNTLQSNQSNLIYHENPFTPVTQNAPGRIEVTSKRGKTLYMTENQIRKMGSKMLAEGEIERALGRSNPNVYKAGQGKFRRETQKSMQRAQHQAAAEAEAAGYFYPRSFVTPSDSKFHQKKWYDGIQIHPNPRGIKRGAYPPMGRNNPFWVTPQGTAVHHSDKAWTMYQGKNEGARLPAQAEREALLERQPTSLAPGFTVRVESMMTSNGRTAQAHKLFYKGRDTGKYALDGRKAIEISHAIDPETGKRRKA